MGRRSVRDGRAMTAGAPGRLAERLRRAFGEFLTIPILVVLGFLALALVAYWIDVDAGPRAGWNGPWAMMARYVGDPAAAAGLLTTIAGSLITVTSITFSILLLAVQQGASALTSQIIEHYLRRASNQVYFGFFVGVSVFALVTLVLTTPNTRPVMGVTLATLLAAASLFALILLIYSTIDQVKPVTIITRMRDATLAARRRQARWLAHVAEPTGGDAGAVVETACSGYLVRVRLARLEALARRHPGVRIEVVASLGDYLAQGAPLARVRGVDAADAAFAAELRRALPVEEQRDIGCDAAYGVDQLTTIAWTSASTAKSNPAAAGLAIHALGDILLQWSDDPVEARSADARVLYGDTVAERLLDGFESLAVVASESMQHQSLAAVMDALAAALPVMPSRWGDRVERIVADSLPALGDHVPTRVLQASFTRTVAALRAEGRTAAAEQAAAAWRDLAQARGRLSSRGNREPSEGGAT